MTDLAPASPTPRGVAPEGAPTGAVGAPSGATAIPEAPRSLWSDAWSTLRQNRAAMTAAVILGLLVLLVLVGPSLSDYRFDKPNWDEIAVPPSLMGGHLFGTDSLGRDLFTRTLMGGRMSLLVGIVSTLVSLIIGIAYGATAGFLGGRTDRIMMRIVDILYALPFMFLVILLMVLFGRNILLIFVAIGAINWLDMARIVRGQTLGLKQREFIEAARVSGVKPGRIILRHIVPNLLGVVVIYVTLTIPQVILVESFLSFLGLGVQEPMTSWGVMVSDGALDMENAPWMLVFPATFLAVTLFCFNYLGDGLRDALDPRDRSAR
jgi:oligopeptide transport system permease protein